MESFDAIMSEQIKHPINKVTKYLYEFWGFKETLSSPIQSQFLSGKNKKKKLGLIDAGFLHLTNEIILTDDVVGEIDFLPSLAEEITHGMRKSHHKPTDIQVEEFFGRLGYLYMCERLGISYKPYYLVESSVKKYREPVKGYEQIMSGADEIHSIILSFLQEGLTILEKSNDVSKIRSLYQDLSNYETRKLYTLEPTDVQEMLDEASRHLAKANTSKFHLYRGRKKLWYLMKNLIDTFEMEKLKLDMAMKRVEIIQAIAERDIWEHKGYEAAERHYSTIKSMTPEDRYSLLLSKPNEVREKFFK